MLYQFFFFFYKRKATFNAIFYRTVSNKIHHDRETDNQTVKFADRWRQEKARNLKRTGTFEFHLVTLKTKLEEAVKSTKL